jgi:tetraacyldisaccharide 4'-kinase
MRLLARAQSAAWPGQPERLPVPVIVVGNIIVGGAGKTPLTLWLAGQLRSAAGGRASSVAAMAANAAGPRQAGELASSRSRGRRRTGAACRRSGVPVWVGRDRPQPAALLAAHPEVECRLCDDGLQHYRLARDVELAVFDGRGAGNGWRLPARAAARAAGAAARSMPWFATVCPIAGFHGVPQFSTCAAGRPFLSPGDPQQTCAAGDLAGRRLHAWPASATRALFPDAGSAWPVFCETRHPFPDHHRYSAAADLAFAGDGVLLMTEKDAVKCAGLTAGRNLGSARRGRAFAGPY